MLSWLIDRLRPNRERDALVMRRCAEGEDIPCPTPECNGELFVAAFEDLGEVVTCDLCEVGFLVTCEAYDKVTPEGGPARLRLRKLKPHPRPAQRMKDAELGIQRRGGW